MSRITLEQRIQRQFIERLRELLRRLRVAVAERDLAAMANEVSRLRNSSRAQGYADLSQLADEVLDRFRALPGSGLLLKSASAPIAQDLRDAVVNLIAQSDLVIDDHINHALEDLSETFISR